MTSGTPETDDIDRRVRDAVQQERSRCERIIEAHAETLSSVRLYPRLLEYVRSGHDPANSSDATDRLPGT